MAAASPGPFDPPPHAASAFKIGFRAAEFARIRLLRQHAGEERLHSLLGVEGARRRRPALNTH
jgi:hypothetical protein